MHERRKDYPDIIARLHVLEALQNRDLDEAKDWRQRFCEKLDKLIVKFDELPCGQREGRYLSQQAQIKWLWIAITFIMAILTKISIWH